MDKIKILALFGKSASGKNTIQQWIVSHFPQLVNRIVPCTTRPPRDGEQNGIDYFFLSNEEFTKQILNCSMIEATSFRDWFYGTSFDQLDPEKINVGVFNIAGIESILTDSRLEVEPVLIHASDKIRLLRSLQREQNPDCNEICRRFQADKKDFDEMDDFEYWGWINEDIDLHSSQSYRYKQFARILEGCGWANIQTIKAD